MLSELLELLDKTYLVCDLAHSTIDLCVMDKGIMFVKFKPNADKISPECATKLKAVARIAGAEPVMVSRRSSHSDLEEGVIYKRQGVPVVSPETFPDFLEGKSLAYAERGCLKAFLDSKKLKSIRTSKKLSMKDVANDLQVSVEMVRRYESGESMPSFDIFNELVELFGESIITQPDPEYSHLPDNPLSRMFRDMGFDAEAPMNAPFDIIARGKKLFFGVLDGPNLEKKASLLEEFTQLLGAHAFLIGDMDHPTLPVIKKEELKNLKEKDLLERV